MALCTPDWLLERIALGELPSDALAAARAKLEQESHGAARLARLESDSRETLARHPPESVSREVARRLRTAQLQANAAPQPERQGWHGWSLSMPVAASLVLLFLSAQQDVVESPSLLPVRVELLETVGIKGDARLLVYRQDAGAPELLSDHTPARTGDLLQLSYISGGHRHGVVVSVDGRGAVTLHHPTTLVGPTKLQSGDAVSLTHSYELDDAPGFERFFLVTSDSPLDVGSVLEAARLLARHPTEASIRPLPLPGTLAQTSFTLEKVP
ncbi:MULTISPECIES: ActD protein [unclassified Myxococcus]|uniref:ActD protein n=1 Tax=unclassified Myxococcus TaxID=2648731 RepID=UPI00157AEFEB|nr:MULTISPECIES: ActD protein [unclassified Myxococcus]NTX07976.1 ActD protein [Myxococcus sp. CA040A]NTX40608.1 ActD protein [Myxococcus sp. CA033]